MARSSARWVLLWLVLLAPAAAVIGCHRELAQPQLASAPAAEQRLLAIAGSGDDGVDAMVAVGEDVVVVGTFAGAVQIGPRQLVAVGGSDAYAARLGPDLTPRWVCPIGGAGDDRGFAVAKLADGGVVVGGSFAGTVTVGSAALTAANDHGVDAFIVALSAQGDVRWMQRYGDRGDDLLRALAVASDGRIYGAGSTTTAAGADAFLIALDRNGARLWEQRWSGAGDDIARGLAVTPDGGVVVAGHFSGNAAPEQGAIDIAGTRLVSHGDSDALLAAFDRDGVLRWARAYGGPTFDIAKSVVVGADGLYVTGIRQRDDLVAEPGQPVFFAGGFRGWFAVVSPDDGEIRREWIDPAVLSGHHLAAGDPVRVAGHRGLDGERDEAVLFDWPPGQPPHVAQLLGSTGSSYGYAVAVTPRGDVVVAGSFTGRLDAAGTTITAQQQDGYVWRRAAARR